MPKWNAKQALQPSPNIGLWAYFRGGWVGCYRNLRYVAEASLSLPYL